MRRWSTTLTVSKNCSLVTLQGRSRRRPPTTERLLPTLALALFPLAVAPGYPQEAKPREITSEQARQVLQQALRTQHRTTPEPVGSLRLDSPTDMFTSYRIEVSDDHSPDRPSREIRITEQTGDRASVLYDERVQDTFLYMFPLDLDETLLATVWETPTAPAVRVYRIRDHDVKLVMEDGSLNSPPQFVRGDMEQKGLVLLGRGRDVRDNVIYPASTEIWQWSEADDRFVRKTTVPYLRRWTELGNLLAQQTDSSAR